MNLIYGKFKFSSSTENFDQYLQAMGTSEELCQMAVKLKPTVVILDNGGKIKMIFQSTFKDYDIEFALGVEFEETLGDGRKAMSIVTMESESKMKHVQKLDELELIMYREFSDAEMKCTLEAPGVTCIRIFNRIG